MKTVANEKVLRELYTELVTTEINEVEVMKNYISGRLRKHEVRNFMKVLTEGTEQDMKDFTDLILLKYPKYNQILQIIRENTSEIIIEDTRKEYRLKEYKRRNKTEVNKDSHIDYIVMDKVDGNQLKPKGSKSIKYFYAVHVIDRKQYVDKVVKKKESVSNILNKDTLRYIGQTNKPTDRFKNHLIGIYKRADYDMYQSNNLYQGLKSELLVGEEPLRGKMLVFDIIGIANTVDFNRKAYNLEDNVTDEEVIVNYSYSHFGINLKDLEIIEYILISNATSEQGHKLLNKQYANHINQAYKIVIKDNVFFDKYIEGKINKLFVKFEVEGSIILSSLIDDKKLLTFEEVFEQITGNTFSEDYSIRDMRKVHSYIEANQLKYGVYYQELKMEDVLRVKEVCEEVTENIKDSIKYTRKTDLGKYTVTIEYGEELVTFKYRAYEDVIFAVDEFAKVIVEAESYNSQDVRKCLYNLQEIKENGKEIELKCLVDDVEVFAHLKIEFE